MSMSFAEIGVVLFAIVFWPSVVYVVFFCGFCGPKCRHCGKPVAMKDAYIPGYWGEMPAENVDYRLHSWCAKCE